MPDILAQALATPGLTLLLITAFVAGLVRGFAGFGTAMIYMPVAGAVLSPFGALITLTVMDVLGPLPLLPRAFKDRHPGDMGRLLIGLVLALPFGVWALGQLPTDTFRYAVSGISLLLLVLLVSGLRYRGRLSNGTIVGTGLLGGALGGATGLAGPPVILLYMASTHPAQVVRATMILYLLMVDLLLLAVLGVMDRLNLEYVVLGLVVMLPYLLGNVIGGWIFRPGWEKTYRAIAYVMIAASAITALPLWE